MDKRLVLSFIEELAKIKIAEASLYKAASFDSLFNVHDNLKFLKKDKKATMVKYTEGGSKS